MPITQSSRSASSQMLMVVSSSLTLQGYSANGAAKVAEISVQTYAYLRSQPLEKSVEKAYDIASLGKTGGEAAQGLRVLATSWNTAERFMAKGALLSGAVDLVDTLAKRQGIELNQCLLAMTKVSLDGLGVATGGLTAEDGFGVFMASMNAIALGVDLSSATRECLL